MRIGYIEIGGDPDAWGEYATEVLGAPCCSDNEGLIISIDDKSTVFVRRGLAEDVVTIGWDVGSLASLEQVMSKLNERRIEYAETKSSEDLKEKLTVSVLGPDELQHQFYYSHNQNNKPSTEGKIKSKFIAGDLGVGHMAIASGNFAEATKFYEEIVGMKLSDYIDFSFGESPVRVSFFRCNERHHSIALIPVNMDKKLNHLMLEYREIDDLGARYDAAKRSKYPIVTGLGRHTNDKMISFYQTSPSGFDIECGYGGVLVDDQEWEVGVYDAAAIWGHENYREAVKEDM